MRQIISATGKDIALKQIPHTEYRIERNVIIKWTRYDHIQQGLYSLCSKTSYRQISWSLEAARMGVISTVSLWHV